MNMREILDMHPLPEDYYYKVDHTRRLFTDHTVFIMKTRRFWFDKKIAEKVWKPEYNRYDRHENNRDLHEFLNTTVPVLDMRSRKDKVVPMVADVHMPQDTEPRWFRQVDSPALMR